MLEAYARYMNACRTTAAGLRDSDNWQKGIPLPAYMKSGWRHFMDWWRNHRDDAMYSDSVVPLCALIFNASGYLHEIIQKNPEAVEIAMAQFAVDRAAEVEQRKQQASEPPV